MRRIGGVLLIGTALVTTATAQAPFPQFRKIHAGVAGDPRAIVTADFDNDGDMDFATANVRSQNPASVTIALWIGPGSSGAFKVTRIDLPEGPIALTAIDVNRDGAKDLAVVSADAGVVSILLNDRSGAFAVADQFVTGDQPRDIVSGDFNRDGRPDLAVAVFGCDCLQIAELGSDGHFHSEATDPVGGDPWGLAAADFDGDGILDLVTTSSATNRATVLYGDGGGGFGTTVQGVAQRFVTPIGRSPRAVTTGDFNRDGRIDFATANTNDQSASVVLGAPGRTFAAPLRHHLGRPPRDVEVVDVNGDGHLDLLAAEQTTQLMLVLLGRGDGCFGGPRTSTGCAAGWTGFQSGEGARNIAYGDFDRDGRVDIVVANQSGFVTLFLNETAFVGR